MSELDFKPGRQPVNEEQGMQLVFAIVQDEDGAELCRHLNHRGHRVTRIRSSGGFLAQGNITVVVGVEDRAVPGVLATIRQTCHMRKKYMNPMPWGHDAVNVALAAPTPIEVEVGGATVFTVPVRRFLRLRGAPVPPAADEVCTVEAGVASQDQTDLVLAIVRAGEADRVTEALIRAGFRLTRIPTAGAFLRRPNMTLMCAVPRPEVDQVLAVIQESCRFRAETDGQRHEMPKFSATVFVVELAQFITIPVPGTS